MRGYLRKRSKGSWTIEVSLGRDEMGRRRSKTMTVKGTKREAERVLNDLINEVEQRT